MGKMEKGKEEKGEKKGEEEKEEEEEERKGTDGGHAEANESGMAVSSSLSSFSFNGAVAYEIYSTLRADEDKGKGKEKMWSTISTVEDKDEKEEEEEEEVRLALLWVIPLSFRTGGSPSWVEKMEFFSFFCFLLLLCRLLLAPGVAVDDAATTSGARWETPVLLSFSRVFLRRRITVTSPSIKLLKTNSNSKLNIHEKLKNSRSVRRGAAFVYH